MIWTEPKYRKVSKRRGYRSDFRGFLCYPRREALFSSSLFELINLLIAVDLLARADIENYKGRLLFWELEAAEGLDLFFVPGSLLDVQKLEVAIEKGSGVRYEQPDDSVGGQIEILHQKQGERGRQQILVCWEGVR